MLLPGVTLDGTKTDTSPVSPTRLLRFNGGKWTLAANG
jgi:hypothetical protein